MNIKRAFFAAVALLMVPGFAMAQTTITFDTSLDFQPDGPYTQTVQATLTCNTGNPLQQSFQIGPTLADKVVFVVDNFNEDQFISCEITASTLSGFVVLDVLANGDDTGTSCLYEADPDTGTALQSANTCVFEMAPAPLTLNVTKVWEISDNSDLVDFAAGVDWTCYNVADGADGSFASTFSGSLTFVGPGSQTKSVTGLHPGPAGNSYCTVEEDVQDSAVEAVNGCAGNLSFTIGDNVESCTITNTVFFEGIPTLSQYGLAIMALLMLGVGFIGFRRFV